MHPLCPTSPRITTNGMSRWHSIFIGIGTTRLMWGVLFIVLAHYLIKQAVSVYHMILFIGYTKEYGPSVNTFMLRLYAIQYYTANESNKRNTG